MTANRHWDDLARDVLLATGDTIRQPQVGYFVAPISEHQNVEESDIADSVAMAFLGTRIGCARCHNHPLEKYTQDDYYHFAAFFSRVVMKRPNLEKYGGPTTLAVASRDEVQIEKQIADAAKNLAEAKDAAKITELEKRRADLDKQLAAARLRPPTVNQPRTGKPMAPQQLDGAPAALAAR